MSYESYKTKYINGKQSGVTDVGISGISDNPDYLLEIDEASKVIQITAKADNTFSENLFAIQREADPQLVDYSYSPQSDSQYIYDVTVI